MDDPGLNRIIEEVVFRIIQEGTIDKTAEESTEIIIIEIVVIVEIGIGLERDHSQEIMAVIDLEAQAVVD